MTLLNGVSHDLVCRWLFIATLIMDGYGMTIEEYVEKLKELVPPMFVEDSKDWPTSDKLYAYLHMIQLQEMADFKELLKQSMRMSK